MPTDVFRVMLVCGVPTGVAVQPAPAATQRNSYVSVGMPSAQHVQKVSAQVGCACQEVQQHAAYQSMHSHAWARCGAPVAAAARQHAAGMAGNTEQSIRLKEVAEPWHGPPHLRQPSTPLTR